MAAQYNVERIGKCIVRFRPLHVEPRDESLARGCMRDAVEDRIQGLQRVTGKVHLRDQARENAGAKEREMNMRRPPCVVVIAPGIGPGLDGLEPVITVFVGDGTALASEIRIERGIIGVNFVAVASRSIGLPDFHQRASNRPAIFVKYPAVHVDAFSKRSA